MFENIKNVPMTAPEVHAQSDMTLPAVSNILREMCEDGVLARSKNHEFRWQYVMHNYHNPDEYIVEIRGRKLRNKEIGALKTCFKKEREKYLKLKEECSTKTIVVPCECGRNLSIQVKAEVIGEYSPEERQGDGGD